VVSRGSADPLDTSQAGSVTVILADVSGSHPTFRNPASYTLGDGSVGVAALDLDQDPQLNPDIAVLTRPTPGGEYQIQTLRNDRGTGTQAVFAQSQITDPGAGANLLLHGNVDSTPGPEELIVVSKDTALLGRATPAQAKPFRGFCRADFNHSGSVSPADIFAFLNAYFGGGAGADFNRDGVVSPSDIFGYLNAYFAPC